jgi:hypothetical protein
VQNFWIQLLADVGVVGLVLALVTFGTALAMALRARTDLRLLGLIATGWICVTIGSLNGTGIVAGLPLDALVWMGLGLAAAVGGLE